MNLLVLSCAIVLFSSDFVKGYNVDVNFPILYKGPDNAHFGYSLAVRTTGNDNWLQVGAPKGLNARLPRAEQPPGTVYRCPFKQLCRHLDIDVNGNINGERKDGSWLGGSMDVNTETDNYAVCSHRRINEKWTNIYYMTGSCYWGFGLSLPRKLLPLENHETYTLPNSGPRPIIVYDWGNGLAGASVHIPSLRRGRGRDFQLVIGAPGVFNLRGAAILYKDLLASNDAIVTNPYKTSAMTKDDDYVGYQVSSGYFFNINKLLYVASAPRASNYKGKVMIFEFPTNTREGMIILQELVGDTFGEYFGASLASGDLDGDELDDLVIGAPNWSLQEDEGRVYVYSGSNTDKLTKSSVFSGKSKGAMFGYSVQVVGDLDRDGYNDLAVGSPYEDDGSGALYIYYGGVNGVSEERSTQIFASKLYPSLKGFGVSLSKAEDVDRNGYKDFAVGSFISGHAVLLRSRPVAEIMVSLEASIKNLDHEATKFQTNLCVIYLGQNVSQNLNLVRRVSADVASGRLTLVGTGGFENEAIVQVTKNTKSCEILEFDLKAKNNYDPLEIIASYSLQNESDESNAILYADQVVPANDRFCSNCPVLRLGSRTRASITISFASNCGDDGECNSDLKVSGKFNGITNGAYIIGSDASMSLEVEVENLGENAYLTQLHVQIPKPVDLESIPSTCQQDEMDDKSITITCFVANPLHNDTKKNIPLSLDMSKVGVTEGIVYGSNSLQFNISATTISKNKNDGHTRLLRMNLKTEFDITVTGKTPQDTLSYDTPENGTETDILKFQHSFAVQKFGSSPVHEALLTVMLPYSMQLSSGHDINFLTIYSISGAQDGQPLQCSTEQISYQVDSEYSTDDFDFDGLENANETFQSMDFVPHTRTTRQVTPDALPRNRTLFLNCDSHLISCHFVKCRVGPFIHAQTIARLEIGMTANITALRELLGNHDLALFSSAANILVRHPDGTEQSPVGGMLLRPDDFVLSTLFIGSPKSGAIAVWIIALSVVVGLLLLSLLIAGLVKAGFFKRKTKEELEALKEAEQAPAEQSEEEALNGNADNSDKDEAT